MKVSFLLALVVTMLSSILCSSPTSADDGIPDTVKDWKLFGAGTTVQSDIGYCFQNQSIHQSIQYGKRGSLGGINLVWDRSDSLTNVRFVNESGGEVRYGQRLALRVDGIKTPFLHHEKRTLGINLNWANGPVFEWIIVGGAEGEPVKAGDAFAVINTVEKDFLIYAKRGGKTINLRWYADRNEGGYMDRLQKVVKKEGFSYASKYLTR